MRTAGARDVTRGGPRQFVRVRKTVVLIKLDAKLPNGHTWPGQRGERRGGGKKYPVNVQCSVYLYHECAYARAAANKSAKQYILKRYEGEFFPRRIMYYYSRT